MDVDRYCADGGRQTHHERPHRANTPCERGAAVSGVAQHGLISQYSLDLLILPLRCLLRMVEMHDRARGWPRGSRAMEVALGAQRRRHAACRRHCCSHKPSRPPALRARCRAAAQRLWYFTTVRVWCGRQASVPVAQQQRWCQQYSCSTPGRLPRRWRNDGSCTARRARESWLSLLHEVELPCCAVRWCSIGLHESITRTRHAHESPRR